MAKMAALATKAWAPASSTGARSTSRAATRRADGADGRGSALTAHASATRASGSRTRKIDGQPKAPTSTPATSGPALKPSPMAALRKPSARPRVSGVASSVTMPGTVP